MTAARTQPAPAANAVATLCKFNFDSMWPFSGPASDAATSILTEAHAVTIILSNALADRQSEGGCASRDQHIEKAVDAVGTMIALAAFLLEGSTDA